MNSRSAVSLLAVLLAFLSLGGGALSASAGVAANVQAAGESGQEAVRVRAVAQHGAAKPGAEVVVAVVLEHAEGYHTWPSAGVTLPADVAEFAIRTSIDLAGPSGWMEKPARVQWPAAKDYTLPSLMGDGSMMTVPLYSGRAVAYVTAIVPATAGDYELEIAVGYQACDDTACLAPVETTLKVPVKVSAEAVAAVANEADLFKGYDATAGVTPPKGASAPSANPNVPIASGDASDAGVAHGATIFGFSLGSGFVLLVLASIVGGFVLNLTPCVLPVIPIKVLTLTQHAASKKHALVLGLWMAAGVVAFWVAIGVPMAFISANLDPSRYIFGMWWVTLGIGLVIALMGLGIMGLFSLNLPQAVYMVDAKADSPLGSFMFGVLTAVLGLPCFGFVAGGLLAGAATLPPLTIMGIFGGLGVGMAAPYLVLSAKPSLLRFIPRTGPASVLVKQVMGILLMAAAAFFMAAGLKALLADRPYLAGSIAWWVVAFFISIAGVWLIIRTLQISKAAWPKVMMTLLAVAMVGGIWMFALGRTREDERNWNARSQAMGHGVTGEVPSGVWLPYSPELFKAVRASGRSVFLDFTADWCFTCHVLKQAILEHGVTKARLTNSEIVLMEVDCSSTNSPSWTFLRELGRTGLPTWVIYGPTQGPDGKERPIILDLTKPTHGTVLTGLQQAGVKMGPEPSSTAAR